MKFNEDGTVNIKADCNVAIGSYQLSGDQLTIQMGPTTLAECGPESSYSQFLTLLEQAAGVGMGYGNLVITLAHDAGEMIFQRATTISLAAGLEPITEGDLVDTLWQWVSLVETMPASQSMVANSENYNLVFRTDGTYSAKADCNQLLGSYELLGSQLKLVPGISTLAEWGPDSSYDLYSSLLERVVGAGTREGVLVLVLAEDAGIMNFQNAGEAPQAGGFGSFVVVPGAGFLLNNEMGDFNKKPGETNTSGDIGTPANLIAPGKRMLSSMTPVIVRRDGRTVLVTGSPGGRTIPNTVLNIVLNVTAWGMPVRAAVDAQRIHHQWLPDMVVIEQEALDSTGLATLKAAGHDVRVVPRWDIGETGIPSPSTRRPALLAAPMTAAVPGRAWRFPDADHLRRRFGPLPSCTRCPRGPLR